MYKKGGIAGINKGVNAVAVRQCTNWGSRCVASMRRYANIDARFPEWDSLVSLSRLSESPRDCEKATSSERWTE